MKYLLLVLFVTLHSFGRSPVELSDRIGVPTHYPQIVRIIRTDKDGQNYMCSGTIVRNGYIVTAAHCVETSQVVEVEFEDGQLRTFHPVVVGVDNGPRDFAIIRGDTRHILPAVLSHRSPRLGDIGLFISKNPRQKAFPLAVLGFEKDGVIVYQGRVIGGDSGSAMFGPGFEIQAIIFARDAAGLNIGFAVDIAVVLKELDRL